jgi:hypothetical protein
MCGLFIRKLAKTFQMEYGLANLAFLQLNITNQHCICIAKGKRPMVKNVHLKEFIWIQMDAYIFEENMNTNRMDELKMKRTNNFDG